MPRYELKCQTCDFEFEEDLKIDEPCPPCTNEIDETICMGETEKLISRNTFHLKGSGWAKDGY